MDFRTMILVVHLVELGLLVVLRVPIILGDPDTLAAFPLMQINKKLRAYIQHGRAKHTQHESPHRCDDRHECTYVCMHTSHTHKYTCKVLLEVQVHIRSMVGA